MTPRVLALANVAWRMRRGLPTFLSVNVTNRCTQRCPMCTVWRSPSSELSLAELTDALTGFRRAGLAVVEVSGGEPFCRPDIFEILAALDRLGYLYSLNTNGTLLTPRILERLGECRGLLQLAISLDSLDRERYARLRGTDGLPQVLEAVELASAQRGRVPVKLSVAVSRVNRDEVLGLLAFARERRLGLSVFPVIQGTGFEHRSADALFAPSDDDRRQMADLFRHLARLRREGEPLWEFSAYYETAAEYVSGRPIGPCDAGRVFFDLRADGGLAACVDLPATVSVRRSPVPEALARVADEERERIRACSESTPCCYTCTANITRTARHPMRFVLESLQARTGPVRLRRRRTMPPDGDE